MRIRVVLYVLLYTPWPPAVRRRMDPWIVAVGVAPGLAAAAAYQAAIQAPFPGDPGRCPAARFPAGMQLSRNPRTPSLSSSVPRKRSVGPGNGLHLERVTGIPYTPSVES